MANKKRVLVTFGKELKVSCGAIWLPALFFVYLIKGKNKGYAVTWNF